MSSRFPSPEITAALLRAERHAHAAADELAKVRALALKSRAKDAPFLAATVWAVALEFRAKAEYFGRLSVVGR